MVIGGCKKEAPIDNTHGGSDTNKINNVINKIGGLGNYFLSLNLLFFFGEMSVTSILSVSMS